MSGAPNNFSIAIVGGGIGGLVAAISLRQRGHNITVVEHKQQYHESAGGRGGVTLSWNAVRCLLRLGIEEELKHIAEETPYHVVRRHSDGSEVSRTNTEKRFVLLLPSLRLGDDEANGYIHRLGGYLFTGLIYCVSFIDVRSSSPCKFFPGSLSNRSGKRTII